MSSTTGATSTPGVLDSSIFDVPFLLLWFAVFEKPVLQTWQKWLQWRNQGGAFPPLQTHLKRLPSHRLLLCPPQLQRLPLLSSPQCHSKVPKPQLCP
uniref:Uncharacterized protein n=1 Tax=Fagus sylvatica TaxID=28930 RepID=A0A2N9GWD4_FAGSY